MQEYSSLTVNSGELITREDGTLSSFYPEGADWFYDYFTGDCISRTPPYARIPMPDGFRPPTTE